MKGFALDQNGDVVIEAGKIKLVYDNELLFQKVQTVLGTNQGEWIFNKKEGIRFNHILGKNPDYDFIQSEILQGLGQVDESFYLEQFECDLPKDRTLAITFKARNETGNIVEGVKEWL